MKLLIKWGLIKDKAIDENGTIVALITKGDKIQILKDNSIVHAFIIGNKQLNSDSTASYSYYALKDNKCIASAQSKIALFTDATRELGVSTNNGYYTISLNLYDNPSQYHIIKDQKIVGEIYLGRYQMQSIFLEGENSIEILCALFKFAKLLNTTLNDSGPAYG